MANNYRFYVDAMTGDAIAKLEEVNKLMDKIDSKSAKGTQKFFHTTQREIDEAVADMQRLIQMKKELDRNFEKQSSMAEATGSMTDFKRARANLEQLQSEFQKTQNEFQKLASMKANPNFTNKTALKEQRAYREELTEQEKALQAIKKAQQELNHVNSRVNYRARQATSTGRMTHNQSESMKKDLGGVGLYSDTQRENKERQAQLREQYRRRQEELSQVRSDTNLDRQVRKNRETSILEEIKGIEQEIEARKKFNQTLNDTIENLKAKTDQLNNSNVKVEADRNSTAGVIASRAPSIAIAGIGSAMAAMGGLYAKGATANAGMRDSTISLGQRTGNGDFRAIRKEAQTMGIEKQLGYKGADMLQFQEDALSNIGFTNKEDLTSNTRALAEGSRAVPVDSETLSGFMNDQMRRGAVSGKDQIKAIQEGFLGAIQKSGMVGREKEQLNALKTLSDQSFSGRNGSNEELKQQMAMLTLLNKTGSRAVQGEEGAELMTSLSAGIQNSIWNNKASLLLGKGTKYQGGEGMYALKGKVEEGATAENVGAIIGSVQQSGGSEDYQKFTFASALHELFGTDAKNDQIDAMWKAYANGNLNEENINKIMNESQSTGKDKYKKNADDYANSKEGMANRSEAVTEKQASGINDYGDALRGINSKLGGIPPGMYALGAGMGALATALITSGGMSLFSGKIKQGIGTMFSTGTTTAGAGSAGGSFFKGVGQAFKSGKATGGWSAGLKNAGSTAKDLAGANIASADSIAGVTKAGSMAGKVGKVAGKVALPLALVGSAIDIASSDDKVKSVGENAGGLAGGFAGAKLGALAGTAIMPGVGTVIGGALGAVGGSLIGNKAGGGLIDGVRKFFGGEEAYADEVDTGTSAGGQKTLKGQENKSGKQEERDMANKHVLSEKTRAENNAEEATNLSIYSKLLDRAQRILNQARNQNGIFGNSKGANSSSDSGGIGDDPASKDFGGDWEKAIRQASKQLGVDVTDQDVDTLLKLIQAESNGDEKAVQQIIDENNFNGSGGAKGLLQYIQSTFDAYKVNGHDDIMSGYDQLLAFFNNSNWQKDLNSWNNRYQNGSTGWGPTGSKTHAMGGHITSPEHALLGEVPGQDEYVINPHQPTAPRLLAEATRKTAQKFRLFGNGSGDNWSSRVGGISLSGSGNSAQAPTLNNTNEVKVNVTVQGGGTSESIANEIGNKTAGKILQSVDDAMSFFTKEMKRV
ncbi:Tail protein, putative tail length tape measure protein [Enterococcus phage Porthos]|uniref:Tail protein n=2 Tax=Enterococcus phage Porthos TaxID=2795670 RepID=A0A8D6XVK0_9CAUD|nr:Tail protein, putative tail length tape measure protein [Enterococcus phage Porthos]